MQVTYSCRDAPTISRFHNSDAFIRGLMGPVGGGKTAACVNEVVRRGLLQKPGPDGVRHSRFVVVRESFRQLEDSTIKTFFQWYPPHLHGQYLTGKHDFIMKSVKAAPNEPSADIQVSFRALDRPDQIGNLLSTEYTGGYINEGRDVPWAVWDALQGRVGRYPSKVEGGCTWFGIWSDTNPPDTDSDWYKFFEEKDLREEVETFNAAMTKAGVPFVPMTVDTFRQIFRQPSGLGPNAENVPNLQSGYYQRQQIGKSTDWIRVYLKGEYGWTLDGLPVFPEYSDELHCSEEPRKQPRAHPDMPIYRSYDFGLTPACVFSQITPTGRWQVMDEMIATEIDEKGMGFDRFSDSVLEHSNRVFQGWDFIDIGDPAGNQRAQSDEKTCFDIARAKMIDMQPAPQTLALRLEGTRKALRTIVDRQPQFNLHPRCKKLRKALAGGYHYRRMNVKGERYAVLPEKDQHSHVADALTYAGAWLFGQALRSPPPSEDAEGRRFAVADDLTRSATTGY